jgi:hypothetical protein
MAGNIPKSHPADLEILTAKPYSRGTGKGEFAWFGRSDTDGGFGRALTVKVQFSILPLANRQHQFVAGTQPRHQGLDFGRIRCVEGGSITRQLQQDTQQQACQALKSPHSITFPAFGLSWSSTSRSKGAA